MKHGSWVVPRCLLLGAFLLGAVGLLGQSGTLEPRERIQESARQAAEMVNFAADGNAGAIDDGNVRALLELDLAALREVNPQVVGWISIPGTPIDYPVVQGADNEYYLDHAWDGSRSAAGAIFVECQNSSDFSGFNTILYGHRMSDSSMFNSLRHYDSQAYLEEHPAVYIVTERGVQTYEIFSACEVTVTDPVYWLITTQEDYKRSVIDFLLERSVLDAGAAPQTGDRLLTLSTCIGLGRSDRRWVVAAVEQDFLSR